MIQKKIIISSLITAVVLPVSAFTLKVHAEELTITSNGQGSSNAVTVTAQNQAVSQQSNEANVTNNTSNNSNTGNNTANDNSGSANVSSGDASNTTNVETNANHNTADLNNCNCTADSTAKIANNGANSDNSVSYNSNVTTTVNSTNTAKITTITSGNVSTGNNHADNNKGDVSIKSGNINVQESIRTATGSNNVHLSTGNAGVFHLDISGNGKGSINSVKLTQNQSNIVNVSNVADILNLNIWNLITGNNTANDNHGDVSIVSGDINVALNIKTVVNSNEVTIDCGCKVTPPPEPPTPPTPPTPPNNGGSGNGSSGGNGGGNGGPGVLSALTGPMLPATGNPWLLLAIIGNLLMLFFGAVLRLKSGRSPGFGLAI